MKVVDTAGQILVTMAGGGGGGGGITNINLSAGTTSNNLSAFVLSNSNNVSFGLNGSTITGTVTVATSLSNVRISGGTTSNLLSALTFADSNGISFGLNASTLTATVKTDYQTSGAYLTTADLSQNSSKYVQNWKLTGNTAGTTSSAQGTDLWFEGGNSITVSGNSNTIKFSVGNYITTGALSGDTSKYMQNWKLTGNTAGTTSSAEGTDLWFEGGNSITVSGNSNTIKFSVGNYITTQTNQQMTFYATSNTTQSSTGTTNASSVIFAGAGIASVGITNGSVVISVPSGGGAADGGNIIAADTRTAHSTKTVLFSNANSVSFGLDAVTGSIITASIPAYTNFSAGVSTMGNTAGSTGVSGTRVVFVGSNDISLSQATDANGATISIQGGEGTISFWEPYGLTQTNITSIGQSTVQIIPMPAIMCPAVFDRALLYATCSASTSSNSSWAMTVNLHVGIYTKNASTLSLATSGSAGYQFTVTGSTSSISYHGWKVISVPLAATLTPGNYWIAMMTNTNSANTNWFSISNHGLSAFNTAFSGEFGVSSNVSKQLVLGYGTWTAQTGTLPNSIAFSDIRLAGGVANRSQLCVNFANGTV